MRAIDDCHGRLKKGSFPSRRWSKEQVMVHCVYNRGKPAYEETISL